MCILIKVADFTTEFAVIERIRVAVFQVEQSIRAEDEFDGKDAESIHLLAYFADEPVGTVRIRAVNNEFAKIERLAVLKDFRNQGLGKKLMERAIAIVRQETYKLIKIHAQAHLIKFYENLGFTSIGKNFIEAGIEHILMTKQV